MIIPDLFQFIVILLTMFFTIFFTPVFQSWILMLESFNIYPFVCSKCCSFWMNLIINILLAYIWTPWFLLWGLITSGVLAYMHIYTDKHLPN